MPSLCVFSKPYIRGLCDPVGRIASYIHFGLRSALTKGWFPLGVDGRRGAKNSLFLYLVLCAERARLTGPSLLNFDKPSRISFILST